MALLSCLRPDAHDTLPRSAGRRYNSQPTLVGLAQRSPQKLQSKRNSTDAPARRKVAKISISQPRDFKHLSSGAGMGGAAIEKANLDEILEALSSPLNGDPLSPTLYFPSGKPLPQLAEIPHSEPLTLSNTRPSPLVQDENVIVVEKGQKVDKRQSRKPPPAITPSVIRSVPVNSPDRAQLPTQPLKLSSSAKGIPANWTNEKALPLPKAQQETGEDSGQGTTVKYNAALSEVQHALKMDLDDPALRPTS